MSVSREPLHSSWRTDFLVPDSGGCLFLENPLVHHGEQTSSTRQLGMDALGPPPQQPDLAIALSISEAPVVLQTDGTATS